MKYRFSIINISILSFLIISCASSGPIFRQVNIDNNSDPLIYIYRPNTVCLMSAKQQFLIDDNLITLKNNEYTWISVSPGTHTIISGEFKNLKIPPLITEINTVRGESYYIKYNISCDSNFLLDSPKFKLHLNEVTETVALDELSKSYLTKIQIQKR